MSVLELNYAGLMTMGDPWGEDRDDACFDAPGVSRPIVIGDW